MTSDMRIAVIPGDGIGKDVTAEAVKVLDSLLEMDPRHVQALALRVRLTAMPQKK